MDMDIIKTRNVGKIFTGVLIFAGVFITSSLIWISNLSTKMTYGNSLQTNNDYQRKDSVNNLLLAFRSKTIYGVTFKKEYDILSLKPFSYLRNYKNPCWNHNDTLRCLPYFYVIGAPKSGTTDLWTRLALHPEFAKPGFKESFWFSYNRFRTEQTSVKDYAEKFKPAAGSIAIHGTFNKTDQLTYYNTITGDFDTWVMYDNDYWPILPGNEGLLEPKFTNADYMYHLYNQTKIIAVLRNPVDRTYSDYFHLIQNAVDRRKAMSANDFHIRATHSVDRYRRCFQKASPRSCAYNKTMDIGGPDSIRFRVGMYSIYIQDYLRIFPRNQVLILKSEDVLENIGSYMKSLFRFLGMSALQDSQMERIVASPKQNVQKRGFECGPMLDETRDMLTKFFRPFNYQLAELLSDDRFKFES